MKTCAPGTSAGMSSWASRVKNALSRSLSSSFNIVNLGSGLRTALSNAGGSRHTPPRPMRSFSSCAGVYSTRPYGGSVTTACIEFRSTLSSHSKASPRTIRPAPLEDDSTDSTWNPTSEVVIYERYAAVHSPASTGYVPGGHFTPCWVMRSAISFHVASSI